MTTWVEVRDRWLPMAFRMNVVFPELRDPRTNKLTEELDSKSLAWDH
jgi:hypothetical protein